MASARPSVSTLNNSNQKAFAITGRTSAHKMWTVKLATVILPVSFILLSALTLSVSLLDDPTLHNLKMKRSEMAFDVTPFAPRPVLLANFYSFGLKISFHRLFSSIYQEENGNVQMAHKSQCVSLEKC